MSANPQGGLFDHASASHDGVPWAEAEVGGRRYRWRYIPELRSAVWTPESRDEVTGLYAPPGPAFEIEFWHRDAPGWRAVRYYRTRVEVWNVVRDEALD